MIREIIGFVIIILVSFLATMQIFSFIKAFKIKKSYKNLYCEDRETFNLKILPGELLEYEGHIVTNEEFETTFHKGDFINLLIDDKTKWKEVKNVLHELIKCNFKIKLTF